VASSSSKQKKQQQQQQWQTSFENFFLHARKQFCSKISLFAK